MAEEPTATDWSYLAGIIDGEGSIMLVHRKGGSRVRNGQYSTWRSDNAYQCHVTISNTDEKMISWIADIFGGCSYCYRRREGNRKPQHQIAWQANDEVRWILENTKPYLLTKYDFAVAILQFLEVPRLERELREILHKDFMNMKEQIKSKREVT